MKIGYVIAIVLCLGVIWAVEFAPQTAGAPSKDWFTDFDKATDAAKKSGRLMMVDFNASWCGPCQQYKTEVFPSQAFKDATKDVVLVDIDIDTHSDLSGKYQVSGIPDIRFLTPDGKEVGRAVGYGGTDRLLEALDQAKSKLRG
jgi:thiol:disulfide interchange protein